MPLIFCAAYIRKDLTPIVSDDPPKEWEESAPIDVNPIMLRAYQFTPEISFSPAEITIQTSPKNELSLGFAAAAGVTISPKKNNLAIGLNFAPEPPTVMNSRPNNPAIGFRLRKGSNSVITTYEILKADGLRFSRS